MINPEPGGGRAATTSIAGIPVYSVEFGQGATVVVLHGWGVDHRAMTDVIEPLFARRTGYRRLYVDLPGMGQTPAPESIASSDDLLDVVLGFVDAVAGDQPLLLIGQSHGGYLARAVADRRPDRIAGLALICPLSADAKDEAAKPDHVVLYRSGDIDGILVESLRGEADGYLVVQTPETLGRFQDREGPGIAVADNDALARIYRRFALSPEPGGVEVATPTLVVTGRQDSFVGFAAAFAWLGDYPRATYAVLDRAGHGLPHEQPELLAQLMSEWLDRVGEYRAAPPSRP